MTETTVQRRVVTGRGMFQNLMTEIRRRKAESKPKRGTCFIEMRTLPRMIQTHRVKDQPDIDPATGQQAKYKSGEKKGQLKWTGVKNPFLDFENRDEDGKPKPTIVHVTRCRASIFYNYTAKVQAAQARNGQEKDFQAGTSAWPWRRFQIEGEDMPFAYKIEFDEHGVEIEQPVAQRKTYLCILPEYVKRDENGVVRKDEQGKPIFYPECQSWYEDIATGVRLTEAQVNVLKEYMAEEDEQAIADAQGHGNIEDIVKPLMPLIQNVTYLAALGKRYKFPGRKFGPINPTDFEALELEVEDDDMTTAEDVVDFTPSVKPLPDVSPVTEPIKIPVK